MSRLKNLFQQKNSRILNMYCTAGYPELESTTKILKSLKQHGADIIEIGIPYSDPLADGPVIQASGMKAIANGMNISVLFDQLKNVRSENELLLDTPLILMGYLNPMLQYGFEKFCAKAVEVGVDALIIPDIPLFEFEAEYGSIVKKYNLDFIFLITPETSEERIRKIDAISSGFLYAVSSSSITGSEKDFTQVEEYLQRVQKMSLKNPVLVGFGIKDKATFEAACKHANGAIIGSAYINALNTNDNIEESTKRFMNSIIG